MTGQARRRPEVVVFDVVETLASLDPVRARLAGAGLPDGTLEAWFTRLLRDAMALSAAGGYAPFAEVASSSLRAHLAATGTSLADGDIAALTAAFGELVPQPDAVAAVEAAVAAGMRVFTLSNGSVDSTEGFLGRAGIRGAVERVLSVDEVRTWKPAAAPYALAVRAAGVAPDRIALVAVHSWDVHGAHRAGLTTGWSPRLEGRPTLLFHPADVTGETLVDVVRALAALPA